MRTYRGTEESPEGVYMSLADGEFIQLYEKTRLLPGTDKIKYIKVPPAIAMAAAPIFGLIFIIFLPFAGVAGFAGYLGYVIFKRIMGTES